MVAKSLIPSDSVQLLSPIEWLSLSLVNQFFK